MSRCQLQTSMTWDHTVGHWWNSLVRRVESHRQSWDCNRFQLLLNMLCLEPRVWLNQKVLTYTTYYFVSTLFPFLLYWCFEIGSCYVVHAESSPGIQRAGIIAVSHYFLPAYLLHCCRCYYHNDWPENHSTHSMHTILTDFLVPSWWSLSDYIHSNIPDF